MSKTMHGLLYITKPLDIKNLTVGDLVDSIYFKHVIHLYIYKRFIFKFRIYNKTVDEIHKDVKNRIRVNNVKNFHINKNKVTVEIW